MATKNMIARLHDGGIVNLANFSTMRVTEILDRDYHALWVYHSGSPTQLMIGTEETCERMKEEIFRQINTWVIEMPAPEVGGETTWISRYDDMRQALHVAEVDRNRLNTLAKDFANELVDIYKRLLEYIDPSDTDELAWIDDRIETLQEDEALAGGLAPSEQYAALHEAYQKVVGELRDAKSQITRLEEESTIAGEVKSKLQNQLTDLQKVADSFQTTARAMEDKVKFLRKRADADPDSDDDERMAALEHDVAEARRLLQESHERNQDLARDRDHILEQLKTLRSSPDDNRVVTADEYENMCLRSEELASENAAHSQMVHKLRMELKRAYTHTDELLEERNKAYKQVARTAEERDRLKRKIALTGTHNPEDTA